MSQQTLGSTATVAHGQLATSWLPGVPRETRTQHRPASRQVNGHGRVSGTHRRQGYRHDLQRNLARIPLAEGFEAFRSAGRALMDLHIGYETVQEWPVRCLVDGEPDEGQADDDAYRIESKMRWGSHADSSTDHSVLHANSRCQLVEIPPEAHDYDVSGRSPLQWAIDSLRHKQDNASGIVDDPNGWHEWADEPFKLIRHLRRLVHVSVETARIVSSLPPALTASSTINTDTGDQ